MTDRIGNFLQAHLGWQGAHRLEPVAGGTSKRTSLLHFDKGKFVLHERSPDDPTWRPGLATELRVWRSAAAAGFAPTILAADADAGLVLSEFVEGAALNAERLASAETWFRLQQLVARLHRLPVQGVAIYSPTLAARHYERGLAMRNRSFPHLAELKALAAEFSYGQTVGHNDLVPENVLDDGRRLWLIDFEFAGRSTPLLDFANLAAFGQRPPAGFELGYSRGIMDRAVRLVRLLASAWLAALDSAEAANEKHGQFKQRLFEGLANES